MKVVPYFVLLCTIAVITSQTVRAAALKDESDDVMEKRYVENAFTSYTAKQLDRAAYQHLLRLFGKRTYPKRSWDDVTTGSDVADDVADEADDVDKNYVMIIAREDFLEKVLNKAPRVVTSQ
uniref:Uncharacterized protein n=1 Tax=Ciona savignyi TaxID=51511 RepID=H2Y5Z9_CIOSA